MDGLNNDLYQLRLHQQKALEKLSNGKILWGGVGTGKSRVAAAYYHKNEAPKRVYVITTAKKRDSFDWQEEFYRIGIGPATGPIESGVERNSGSDDKVRRKKRGPDGPSGLLLEGDVGGETRSVAAGSVRVAGIYPWVLTIDSWNNIAKYADVAGAFFIFDEQRLVGSGDWTRKFLRIAKRNNWILLSGTPGDTWMDYVPVFVANDFYKNRTAFKREHVVYNTFTKFPKVDRYINVGKLMRQRSQLLVEMPFERHTKRRVVEVPLKFDKEALEMVLKKRWNIYENRPLRDVAEMFSVGRKVINSDRSRIEMVQELWKKHPKLIVFYNFNYELELLRGLTTSSPDTMMDASSGKPPKVCDGCVCGSNSKRSGPPDSKRLRIDSCTQNLAPSPYDDGFASTSISKSRSGSSTSSDPKHPLGTSTLTTMVDRVASPSIIVPTRTKAPATTSAIRTPTKTELERFVDSSSTAGFQKASETTGVFTPSTQDVSVAEWNGHKHQPIPSTSRWMYLVQYTAGAEGWNCIETDAMIMYSLNYSWKVFEQACGRTDRLNTPFQDLWYYNFMSESFIDRAIMRSLKAKETFNESKYASLFTS